METLTKRIVLRVIISILAITAAEQDNYGVFVCETLAEYIQLFKENTPR